MTDLLSKFDTIKIENKSRIDGEDQKFCETFNKIYADTVECYKNTLDSLISLYNNQIPLVKDSYDLSVSYYGSHFSISDVKDSILGLKEKFISEVCYHFSHKYNVTINSDKICNKYKDIELEHHKRENQDKTLKTDLIIIVPIDYNMILDEIFIQLNGFTFFEKAIDEIKKKARTPLHWYDYRKYWNYEIKGKTIKFRTNTKDIYPALYYYDSNETKIIDCFSFQKVEDFKSYDNGNEDIKFINASYALDFAKRYLGYIEMTEEEREIYKKKCNR
jgi:hypothetical protein